MNPGSTICPRRSITSAPFAPNAPNAPVAPNAPAAPNAPIRSPSITRVPSDWTPPGMTRSAPARTIMNGNISVMPVLGIDVGGTKTVCLLADADERIIAEGRDDGANLQGAGELALEKVLHSVMEKTLEGTGVVPSAICLGIAGVDRASDEAVVRSIMSRIGHRARLLIVNDALIALQAGIGNAAGIVIVSGTGSIAYGRNDEGLASRAGGWGYALGDEGS